MKLYGILITVLILASACTSEKNINDLVLRDGVVYLKIAPDHSYSGAVVYYSQDKKLIMRGNYEDGIKHGKWIYFTEDGNISSNSIYNNGLLIEEVRYNSKGDIVFEQTSSDNGITLNTKEFDTLGYLKKVGSFRNGVKFGEWLTYNDSGKVIQSEFYDTLYFSSSFQNIDSSKAINNY